MGHIFARLTGFGLTLVPIWPYNFRRSPRTPDSVAVTHWAGEAAQTVTVTGAGEGPAVVLTGVERVDQVVDVLEGPDERVWRIETSPYSVKWPEGFEIDSPPAGDNSSPFLLWGPDRSLIYPQGPWNRDRIPPLTELAGPGQTILSQERGPDFDTVDLAYRHEGGDWRQSHHLVPFGDDRVLVITAQAPATHAELTRQAAETVARSVRVRPRESGAPVASS
ncbi:hypothetical protein [Actinomadura alba]|uniref:hypothetical protein n=1 Tax=Actinomadura alba TaxID=406431 RepID=UPI0031E43753